MEDLYISSTHDYLLFLTNKGRMYRLKCYEIPESSRTSKGTNIVNLLPLESDEKVASMIKLDSIDQEGYLVMVTRQGIIKRTAISAFRNIRKSGLIALTIDEGG